MLGKSIQHKIEAQAQQPSPPLLKEGSFYAQLAQHGAAMFPDEAFAAFYDETLGRPSVPPHLLCLLLLLQWYCGCSDAETIERSAYDLRWQAVLGLPAGMPLCARSTLEAFRDHLITNGQAGLLFLKSIQEAKRAGVLKGPALQLALDTKPILGRGAVLDTFNLIAEAIKKTARALAQADHQDPQEFLRTHGLERYTAASLKGSADLDWSDEAQRDAFLTTLVADAHRLLDRVHTHTQTPLPEAQLLSQLLHQDIAQTQDALGQPHATIQEGTAKGRIPSVTDPEQRHGRKSASKRFTGSKADIACDKPSQIIVAVGDLAGDESDATHALFMVEQAHQNTQMPVFDTTGDCAYGGSPTRQAFEAAGQTLHAKVPPEHTGTGLYPKSRFEIDLEQATVTCPGGHTTSQATSETKGGRVFHFGAVCQECPLRPQCTRAVAGRSVQVHAQEALRQAARAFQNSPEGHALFRERVVVEHCLARLGNLGIGQARYMGRAKTRFQVLICAAVANLRWTWNWEASQIAGKASLGALGRCVVRCGKEFVRPFWGAVSVWLRSAATWLWGSGNQEQGFWKALPTFRQHF